MRFGWKIFPLGSLKYLPTRTRAVVLSKWLTKSKANPSNRWNYFAKCPCPPAGLERERSFPRWKLWNWAINLILLIIVFPTPPDGSPFKQSFRFLVLIFRARERNWASIYYFSSEWLYYNACYAFLVMAILLQFLISRIQVDSEVWRERLKRANALRARSFPASSEWKLYWNKGGNA